VHESLSTIAAYREAADAAAGRAALEAAGIEVEVETNAADETFAGGVKLRVRNEDAIRAGAILDAQCQWVGESETPEEPPPAEPPCECEACQPIRAARGLTFLFVAVMTIGFALAFGVDQAAFFALLAAAVYFLIADRWRCAECGASWN
jgi:hypothetical protein